jgi:hypothetical protein
MLEGRSTPLKPLLILLPEVPFESHISTTKQTWACEHPKSLWCSSENYTFQRVKLHIISGIRATYGRSEMGDSPYEYLQMPCLSLLYTSCCIAVGLPVLNATYCEHLQHTGKLSAPE